MYSPDFSRMMGGDEFPFPHVMLEESIQETFFPVMDQFAAVIDLKQRETLGHLWTGFRVGFARAFIFGAAGLLTLADQLEAIINPDKYYQMWCARIGMAKLCADCGEPDYPLDDKTGLCYTCWTLLGQDSEEE